MSLPRTVPAALLALTGLLFLFLARSADGGESSGTRPELRHMSVLAETLRIKDLTITPRGARKGANRRMRLTVRSEIEDWQKNFVLRPHDPDANTFIEDPDTLCIAVTGYGPAPAETRRRGRSGTSKKESSARAGGAATLGVMIAYTGLGELGGRTLHEVPAGSGRFQSLHLELTARFAKSFPSPARVDTMVASLTSNITDRKETDVRLTETGPDTWTFASRDRGFTVRLVRIAPRGARGRDDLTARVTSRALSVEGRLVDAVESSATSLEFRTDQLHAWKMEGKARAAKKSAGPDGAAKSTPQPAEKSTKPSDGKKKKKRRKKGSRK